MANGSTVNVTLAFRADTKQAKAEMDKLQNSLSNIITSAPKFSADGLTSQMQAAQKSAMDLKIALQSATNVDTGKLNLNKFRASIQQSGLSMKKIGQQMALLGPEGIKAFGQVAQAVAAADTKMFSLTGSLKKLATTFGNTMRYQLSASIITGVTSTISSAVSYVKELDKALTDIRIVTNKTNADMARFAKHANEAAKSLSVATTKYAEASLIFFQQGLDDSQVKERTEVTLKLANAVREDAATVSEWMTAIWNNFDNGSQSLEYYADVLAKLGAATASSADEIANGLSKFASVADTIGLSYEYAAAMLATITAETRQSEEVVGTALKTILSRMQSLSLGETLDDGTTLNKYSQALAAVGVDIKTASGELKGANQILDETAMRWQLLERDQQVALAQSVAGVRQYSQFIAMMETWDKTQQNVDLASNASGALQQMQDTYADSIEGAEQRMKTSAESLYESLFDEETIKGFYEFLSEAIGWVESFTDALGGIPGILLLVASALTKIYQPQITSFLNQTLMSLKDFPSALSNLRQGKGFISDRQIQFKQDTINTAVQNEQTSGGGFYSGQIARELAILQMSYAEQEGKLTEAQKQRYEWTVQGLKAREEELRTLEKQTDELREQSIVLAEEAEVKHSKKTSAIDTNFIERRGEKIGALQAAAKNIRAAGKDITAQDPNSNASKQIDAAKEMAQKMVDDLNLTFNVKDVFDQAMTDSRGDIQKATLELANQILAQAEKALYSTVAQAAKGTANKGQAAANELLAPKQKTTLENDAAAAETFTAAVEAGAKGGGIKRSPGAKGKAQQNEAKRINQQLEDTKKQIADVNKQVKKGSKTIEDAEKEIAELEKKLKDAVESARKLAEEMNGVDGLDLSKKTINEHGEAMEEASEQAEKYARNSAKIAENEVLSTTETNNCRDAVKDLHQTMSEDGVTNWSQRLTNGLSGITSVSSGIMMLSNSVSSLTSKLLDGSFSFSDFAATLAMGLPAMTQVYTGVLNMVKALGLETAAEKLAAKAKAWAAREEEKAAGKTIGARISKAIAGVVQNIAGGYATWPAAIAGIAALAIVGASIAFPALNAVSEAEEAKRKEARAEKTEEAKENLELIDTNQELSTSVSDLVKEYDKLEKAGRNTYDTLNKMRDDIPKLIEQYKHLALTLKGLDYSEVIALEQAYQKALVTGDWSEFTKKQEEIDAKVAEAEWNAAIVAATDPESEYQAQVSDANTALQTPLGDIQTDNALVQANDLGNALDTLAGTLENGEKNGYIIPGTIPDNAFGLTADALSSTTSIQTSLNNLDAIYNDLENQLSSLGENSTAYHFIKQVMQRIIGLKGYLSDRLLQAEVAEGKTNTSAQAQQIDAIAIESFDTTAVRDGKENPLNAYQGITYKEYAENNGEKREELIEALIDYWSGTGADGKSASVSRQAAIAIIQKSHLAAYEQAYQLYGDPNSKGYQALDGLKVSQDQYGSWFAGLDARNKNAALALGPEKLARAENREELLAEERAKQAKDWFSNQSQSEFKISASQFNLYYRELAKLNPKLAENKEAMAEATYQAIKFKNALSKLGSGWEDTWEKINSGNATEVAEGLEKIQEAISETYGYILDENRLEEAAGYINEMMQGNYSHLNEFLKILGQSYLLTIDIGVENEQQALNAISGIVDGNYAVGINIMTEYNQDSADEALKDYINTLVQIASATEEGREAVEGMLNAMNFSVTWSYSEDGTKITGIESLVRLADGNVLKNFAPTFGGKGGSKKEKKNLDDELERYHEINAILEDLESSYDALSKARDRAFGKDRLKLFEQETAALEKQIEAQKEYLAQIKENANNDAATIAQYGATFDERGLISNYDEIVKAQVDKYNEAVEKFNKGRLSESKFKKIEKEYEHFQEALKQYEESLKLWRDEQQKAIEKENERLDLRLEKVTYEVEFKISIQDDALTLLDYYFENIEDNAYKAAEAIALLGQKTDVLVKKNEAYTQGIYDTLEAAGFTAEEAQTWLETGAVPEGKQLTEETIEQLRGYRDELISGMQDARDNAIQAEELIGSSFEYWNSEMDRSAEKLERVNSTLQTYKDIVDLVGAENLGLSTEMVVEMNEAMVAGSIARAKQAKAELDANEAAVKKQRQHYETLKANLGEDDPVTRAAFETLRNMEDQVASSEEELLSAWQDGLQAAVDALSANVDAVIADFEKAMTGIYGSFDALQTAYDQYSQTNERYVADYAKIYELSKLNRDIMKSIDETDNVAAKRELLELQEEINEKQESGVEMSQYELDELRARYDLKLAEMALEDAQNAKSQVRMRRDAEGNWGYVYTADQNAIDSALQNYEDKMYAYQQLTQDYAKEIESQLIGLPQEFAEAMRAIATDVTLTEEERKIRMEETTEFYRSQYKYLLDELEKTNSNSERLYDEDQQAYLKATGQKIIANKDWLDTFNAFTDTDGAYDKFFQATKDVVLKIDEEWKKYDTNIQSVFTAVGQDIDKFLTSDKLKEFQDKQKELVSKGAELGTAYQDGFSAVMTAAQTAASQYQQTIQPMIDANTTLIGQINDAISAYEALLQTAGIEIPDPSKGTGDKADTGNDNPGDPKVIDSSQVYSAKAEAVQRYMGMTNPNGYWGDKSKEKAQLIFGTNDVETAWQHLQGYKKGRIYYFQDASKDPNSLNYIDLRGTEDIKVSTVMQGLLALWVNGKKYGYIPTKLSEKISEATGTRIMNLNRHGGFQAFDTGGYTGSWGSEGRMAMLHQKEIVLNASDTENFLSAIGIVRDIAKAIDLTALSQSTMRANLSAAVGNIGSQVLEQEVTIHAEFPNATNHSEIEEAFNTLLNRASQFANRKNK